jgi:hypothetical protein
MHVGNVATAGQGLAFLMFDVDYHMCMGLGGAAWVHVHKNHA